MKKVTFVFKHFVFALICIPFLQGQTDADVIDYGDFEGKNVWFEGVSEVPLGDDPMYGEPSTSANSIIFNGFGFTSVASNSTDFGQGRLEMIIRAKEGFSLDSIEIEEFGTRFQFGDNASAVTNTFGFVEADGVMYDNGYTFTTTGTGAGSWSDWFKIEFPATSEIRLVLDSQIFATSGEGEISFIDKDGITINVSAVPEPSGLLVILMGVCLGVVTRRRTRRRWKT